MKLKEKIIAALERGRGSFISGKTLSEQFGVSRSAIWKSIDTLKQSGYVIDSVKNRGYRLDDSCDILSVGGISNYLNFEPDIDVRENVGSTNAELKTLAEYGAPEWTVMAARRQSSGRGRLGRSFYSPGDTGLYMSILLRPTLKNRESGLLTTAAAVAVSEAIDRVYGQKSGIKWVNDIFIDGRKVCGILTEAALDLESGSMRYAIVGIGVNVSQPEGGFPPEISDVAGAVSTLGGRKNRLAAEILNNFRKYYGDLQNRAFYNEYRKRLFILGKEVTVVRGNTQRAATVLDLDSDFKLLVDYGDEKEWISSGEVSLKVRF